MGDRIIPGRQAGVGLLEVLVALVVLSVGLLGMAGLQLNALKSATQSYQRSVATLAAIDAQERLWAALANSPDGNCSGLAASVKSDWQTAWFDLEQSPLSPFSGELSSSGCRYTIRIAPPNDLTAYRYSFNLPAQGAPR